MTPPIGPSAWETSTVFAAAFLALVGVGYGLLAFLTTSGPTPGDYCEAWADGFANAWVGQVTEADYIALVENCYEEALAERGPQYVPAQP